MKKIFFSMTLLLSLCACDKMSSTSDEFVPLDTIVCTRTVSFDYVTKSGVQRPVDVELSASYKVKENSLSSFSIRSSDPEIDDDSLKEMVREEFEKEYGFPLENSDLDKIMKAASSDNPTKDCYMSCQSLKKGEGRGGCKIACFMDWLVRFFESLRRKN